jgi:hypothetical protein
LLQHFAYYFDICVLFGAFDDDDDHKLDVSEFRRGAKARRGAWARATVDRVTPSSLSAFKRRDH